MGYRALGPLGCVVPGGRGPSPLVGFRPVGSRVWPHQALEYLSEVPNRGSGPDRVASVLESPRVPSRALGGPVVGGSHRNPGLARVCRFGGAPTRCCPPAPVSRTGYRCSCAGRQRALHCSLLHCKLELKAPARGVFALCFCVRFGSIARKCLTPPFSWFRSWTPVQRVVALVIGDSIGNQPFRLC